MPHPYGILSLMPPVVAIVLAIVTRRAALSLVVGIFFGAMVTTGGNPFDALYDTLEVHLWPTLVLESKMRVFSFTLVMGAMVGIICRSGGMQGLVEWISPLAKTRRSGQLSTWLLGLLIFFDDYANTILLGNTLRPLCDRLRISREKLAYLVDSTAAPVAGLAIVSTWVAVEIDYVKDGLAMLPAAAELKAFDLFIASIPYRFYVLLALAFIPLIALLGRDFGPMLKAERRQLDGADPDTGDLATPLDESGPAKERPVAHWIYGVFPVVCTLAVVMVLLYTTGRNALAASGTADGAPLRDILGAAASSFALLYGALAGLTLAAVMARMGRLLTASQIAEAAGQGARVMLPAIAILWCASSLSRMTSNKSVIGTPTTTPYEFKEQRLYTGDYLAGIIAPTHAHSGNQNAEENTEDTHVPEAAIPIEMLPTVVFLLAAIVSFCTGTSYGTMGILLPMVISLTYTLLTSGGQAVSTNDPILLASVGGVLAGAIFGDHCSPISDTTILSSQACACDHVAHVMTQMPYALSVATVAVLLGTLPLGWGVSVWILLPLQGIMLLVILLIFGQRVEDTVQQSQ
jgi:Na+/H+ antiporter NhaC